MDHDYKSAERALARIEVKEYGTSGRAPIDSALASRHWDSVEMLRKQDPLCLIRPVLSAKAMGGESNYVDEDCHIPLAAMLSGAKASGGCHFYKLGPLGRLEEQELLGTVSDWILACYIATGTDHTKWSKTQKRVESAAQTGRMKLWDALDAMSCQVEVAIMDMALVPRQAPSWVAYKNANDIEVVTSLADKKSWEENGRKQRFEHVESILIELVGAEPVTPRKDVDGIGRRMAAGAATPEDMADLLRRIDPQVEKAVALPSKIQRRRTAVKDESKLTHKISDKTNPT
jgi:hypothetical protein